MWTIKGGGDTQALLAVKKLNFLHSQAAGVQKLQPQALMPERKGISTTVFLNLVFVAVIVH